MPNVKISELAEAATLDGTELVELVQDSENVQGTTQDIADLAAGGIDLFVANPFFFTSLAYVIYVELNDINFQKWNMVISSGSTANGTVNRAGTTLLQQVMRKIATSAAAINSVASVRHSVSAGVGSFVRSASGQANGGGFNLWWRGGFVTARSDQRMFVGMYPSNTVYTTGDPSAKINMAGFGADQADANMQFMVNDGSGVASKTDLGIAKTTFANHLIDVEIRCDPNGATVSGTLFDRDTGLSYSASASANLPAQDVELSPQMAADTGSATGTAVGIAFIADACYAENS